MTFRISINGKHDYLNLGKRMTIDHYDKENKWIKQGIKDYSKYTAFIDKEKVVVDNIFAEYIKRHEVLTFGNLKEEYNNRTGKVTTVNFYDFVDKTIEYERKFTKITDDTLDYWLDQQRKVKLFRNKLSIHDINKKFLDELKYFLESKEYSDNSIFHAMSYLRKYTKKLYDEGAISKYPFANYIIGQPKKVDVDFLMPDELSKLHQLYESGELKKIIKKNDKKHTNHLKKNYPIGLTYQNVLRYYLASCYCGLRFSDIQQLKTREHFKNGYIVIKVKKGRLGNSKTVRIPLRKRLLSLLDLRERGLVFEDPVYENSHTNKCLKEIVKIAGIDKHITFHTARHTFAVVSLLLGVKIEVVSDILGHSELTTTQRYAHIVDELRDKEMDKWDKLIENELTSPSQEQVICPNCENVVMTFEKDIIKLNNLPLACPYCSTNFTHKIEKETIQLKKAL
jgi:integrase